MTAILLNGFLTGLLLQIAIGPIFFFIVNITLQRTIADGLIAVVAVTLADYLFITLAVMGVGKLLEKPKVKKTLGIISSTILILFGIFMIMPINATNIAATPTVSVDSDYLASFLSTFMLTISSPLTIIFWTSLFATKAIENGYVKKQLIVFGFAAGLATLAFLGFSVGLLALIRTSIPIMLLTVSNSVVGLVLIVYGSVRFVRIQGAE